MNEKTKNILKISALWFIINFLGSIPFGVYTAGSKSGGFWHYFSYSFLFLVISPILAALIFLPSIIILYFLFKKIKNPNSRMVLTAFIIPFNNLAYFAAGCFINKDFQIFSMITGFLMLFSFLPSMLITVLCTPKSWLPQKKYFIFTNILTGIFGWILIFLLIISSGILSRAAELNNLKKYQPVIEALEEYKAKNGVYPDTIEDTVKIYEEFSYEPKNENKDYKLTVREYIALFYNYCSNDEIEGCHEGRKDSIEYTKLGNWIKAVDHQW